jgi:hypothetical protein
MKKNILAIASLIVNIAFFVIIFLYIFTPHLDDFISEIKISDLKGKVELALGKEESCRRAEHLRWNGLQEADIKPLLLGEGIEENINYYEENMELIPQGIDAQGGEVLKEDQEDLLNKYEVALREALPIYEEYLEEKERCEE